MEKELEIHEIELENELSEIKKSIYYQKALELSERKFKHIVETSTDWVWEVNQYGLYTYSSPVVEKILGYTCTEIIGKSPFDLMPPDEAIRVSNIFKEYSEHKSPFSNLENLNLHKNGSKVILSTSAVPIINDDGDLIGYRGLDRDVSLDRKLINCLQEEKKETIKAQQLSMHDPLTNLPNRRYFIENKLAQAKRNNERIAFLYIDLDGFKTVNDDISHQAGDEVLKTLSKRFDEFIRKNEFIARIGGDEFCMVVHNFKSKEELKNSAERLIKQSTQALDISGMEIEIGMTIGIALYPEDGKTCDELLSSADTAMYEAKNKEKGSYIFAS